MFLEEWPLLLFTLLSQAAIGTFFLSTLFETLLASNQEDKATSFIKTGIPIVGPLMVAGLFLSFFHLGSPLSAVSASPNLSSWLVREVLSSSVFFALWVICFVAAKKANLTPVMQWTTAIVGLVAVFCMASAYTDSIRPAWAHLNTYFTFFSATFSLGIVGTTISVAGCNGQRALSSEITTTLRKIVLSAVVVILVPLLYQPFFLSSLSAGEPAALASANLYGKDYLLPMILRWLLTLTGIAVLYYCVRSQSQKFYAFSMKLVCTATCLIAAGELLGRCLFFVTAVSTQIDVFH